MNEMRDDFRIGIRFEGIAKRLQFVPQGLVIFDDPVVHQRDLTVGENRVGIFGDRRAMRSPSRMRDADRPRQGCLVDLCNEVRDTRNAAHPARHALLKHGDSA
jgi:hypothetical protein